MRRIPRGNYHFVMCDSRGKVNKSLWKEGFREMMWTCPLCSLHETLHETIATVKIVRASARTLARISVEILV